MEQKEQIIESLKKSLKTSNDISNTLFRDKVFIENLFLVIEIILQCLKNNKKVIFAGNGGSASDAQHLAAEFVCRFKDNRDPLPAISLASDTSVITAIANDYGYENVFSRQLQVMAQSGDVYIAISTSGKSKNILKSLETAKKVGIESIALTGQTNYIDKYADHVIKIPSSDTARIQEFHIFVGHIICENIERFFQK